MIVCVVGIFAIVLLEIVAIQEGVNGAAFGVALAGIGGIVGWWIKHLKNKSHAYRQTGKGDK